MNAFSRWGEFVFWVIAVAVLTGLTHIALILLMPSVAARDAFSILSEIAPVGATEVLPRPTPGARRLPFLDPTTAAAFCRYDLTQGPIRVRAPVGRAGFFSLSFHSRRGAVFYALTDRAAAHGKLEAVIATAAQLRALQAGDDEDNPSQELRIVSPTTYGFVLTRVLSELPSLYPQAEEQARTLQCVNEPTNR